jgi:hypothetical protein
MPWSHSVSPLLELPNLPNQAGTKRQGLINLEQGSHFEKLLAELLFFQSGSSYVAQASFKLSILSPSFPLPSAKITGMHHHT